MGEPKKKGQPRNLPKRKIHFDGGEIWYWAVGRGGVTIMRPDQKRFKIDLATFTGWSWDAIERGNWKGYAPSVPPSYVKYWIELRLREVDGSYVKEPILDQPLGPELQDKYPGTLEDKEMLKRLREMRTDFKVGVTNQIPPTAAIAPKCERCDDQHTAEEVENFRA
jgi:hypothetical protein